MPKTSINLSLYCITGAVTKCDNDSLGLKLVYSWIYKHLKSLLMFSLKFMNMQVSNLILSGSLECVLTR